MDLSSMSDGELRRAHAMFVANPGSFSENPEYMHALVREYTRRFSPGNVEADLDAAATPMPAEPVLQPGRKRSRADWAVDAATAGSLYSPSENVEAMSVGDRPSARSVAAAARARGETPPGYDEWSEGMAQASGDLPKPQRVAKGEAMINRWDRQADAYNRDTGLTPPDTSIADEEGPYPGAGRPGYDRTFTPAELAAQRGGDEPPAPAGYTLPGPRGLDGKPSHRGKPLATDEDAAAYKDRQPHPTIPGMFMPSQYDRDMQARGYVPYYTASGEVAYGTEVVEPAPGPVSDAQGNPLPSQPPGAVGRRGARGDLANSERWTPMMMNGPNGPVRVYVRSQAGRDADQAGADTRTRSRLSRSAEISSADAAGLSLDELRARARAARDDDYIARNNAWKAQSMLAGGQPTGGPRGTKAVTNAWYALGDEGLNDWQRLTMAKALRPDIDGTSPLTVDANSAKNAMRLLNAEVLGQGMMGDARAQMLQQQNRVAADEMAQREAAKLLGWRKGTITRQDAERIRRRIENVYPGLGGVVEGLPIEDDDAGPVTASPGPPPAGYPGAAPSPPPRNPLAAPRPYG